MKKSFIFGAVAAVAAVNLVFGASLANASTQYTVSKLESHNSTSLSDIAVYNGKVLELRNFQDGSNDIDIWSHNRLTGASEQLDGAIDEVGRWELAGWSNSMDAEFDRIQFDGKFWLWAFDSTDENYDLFYSDGTAAGSGIVQTNQESFSTDEIVSTSDGIYFWNSTNDFPDLFFFNGTTVTAMHVTDGFADSYPFSLRDFQGKLSFLVYNWDDERVKQYTAVGSAETLVGIVPGMYTGCFEGGSTGGINTSETDAFASTWNGCMETSYLWWTNDPDTLYTELTDEVGNSDGAFFAGGWYFEGVRNNDGYFGLAKVTGGTLTSTHDVIEPWGFSVFGNYMYFGAYSDSTYEHWNVYKMGLDGVPHVLVADWDGGNTYPKVGAGAGNSFYFPATDASGDTELWVDDSAGAHLALDITPGGDSFPSGFRSAGTEVCFGAFATVDADWYDLYCVSGISSLAATGVDAGGIGTAGVLTLILGGGLAIVGRRFAIAKR